MKFLESVQFRYYLSTEMQLIPAGTGASLPYFVLDKKLEADANTRAVIFRSSVYDPIGYNGFPDNKYPWSGRSIEALIIVSEH